MWFQIGYQPRAGWFCSLANWQYLHCMANCWQPPYDLLKMALKRISPNEIKCFMWFFVSLSNCVFSCDFFSFPFVNGFWIDFHKSGAFLVFAWPQQKPKCSPQFRFSTRFTLNLFIYFWLFLSSSFSSYFCCCCCLVSVNYCLRCSSRLLVNVRDFAKCSLDHNILYGYISI